MEFKKILVPVGGYNVDDETMRMACRIAKLFKSKICSLYVITIKRSMPINAELRPEIEKGEKILDHIEQVAEEFGFELETDVVQARDIGPAIVDEAVERGIDLILMGVRYKQRFGQFSLGNNIMYVLKNSPCHVMLFQEHADGEDK